MAERIIEKSAESMYVQDQSAYSIVTNRRRAIQEQYNKEHNIIPKTIIKEIREPLKIKDKSINLDKNNKMTRSEKELYIKEVEKEMRKAAKELDFEKAANLRDILFELKGE